MPNRVSLIDRTALKFNQGSIITLVITAFALQLPWLIALLALVLLAGTVVPSAGAFKFLYANVLRPLRILRPDVIEEDNAQHLFAQGLGGIFLSVAFIFLAVVNQPIVGWILTFLVAALALSQFDGQFLPWMCSLPPATTAIIFHESVFQTRHQQLITIQGGSMASNSGYANPDVLVTTDWALEHRKDANLRFVEVDVDTSEYEKGHIEGAIGWNWKTQLQDQTRRDILSKEQIERFLGESGVSPDTGSDSLRG